MADLRLRMATRLGCSGGLRETGRQSQQSLYCETPRQIDLREGAEGGCQGDWGCLADDTQTEDAARNNEGFRLPLNIKTPHSGLMRRRLHRGSVVGPDGEVMPSVPDYTPVKYIGRGGFGTVWMVQDQTGHPCALKVVPQGRGEKRYAGNREFSALEKYRPISDGHASILRILHIGKGSGFFYYTMPLADHIDQGRFRLAKYSPVTLRALCLRERLLPGDMAICIVLEILNGLDYIHEKGLIHRDVKPDNILFVNSKPVLGDISLIAEPRPDITKAYTSGYAPPGGCRTKSDDLYSVGKTLYEMVTGNHPEHYPEVPSGPEPITAVPFRDINKVITKACEPKYTSAREMADDLRQLMPTPSQEGGIDHKGLDSFDAFSRNILNEVVALITKEPDAVVRNGVAIGVTKALLAPYYIMEMASALAVEATKDISAKPLRAARGVLDELRKRLPR